MAPAPGAQNGAAANASHTLTALSRWSIALNTRLPPVEKIKTIHVYDFDNTLFKTPQPNNKIWNGATIGMLADNTTLLAGGWWHNKRILSATGEGVEKEEPRAWAGWWNEEVVELVRLSMRQKDALCVLLTGREEGNFDDLIRRIVASKGLAFDLVALKPGVGPAGQKFASTMKFKQAFLDAMLETYGAAAEMRIYEDRPRHVKGFKEWLDGSNAARGTGSSSRPPLERYEVVQVADTMPALDPVTEVAVVQQVVNEHNALVASANAAARDGGGGARSQQGGGRGRGGGNRQATIPYRRLAIRKTVFYTGYLIRQEDTQRLLDLLVSQPAFLAQQQQQQQRGQPRNRRRPGGSSTSPPLPTPSEALEQLLADPEVRLQANSILVSPRALSAEQLARLGGLGAKMRWDVTGIGGLPDGSAWAARLAPYPRHATFQTADAAGAQTSPDPFVVIALRKGARPPDAARIRDWIDLPVLADGVDDPDDPYADTVGIGLGLRLESVLSEKMLLRIESDGGGAGNAAGGYVHNNSYNSNSYSSNSYSNNTFAQGPRAAKRKHAGDDDQQQQQPYGGGNQQHGPRGQGKQPHQQQGQVYQGGGGRGGGGFMNRVASGQGGGGRGGRGGANTPNRGFRAGGGGGPGGGGGGGGRGGGNQKNNNNNNNNNNNGGAKGGGRQGRGFAHQYRSLDDPGSGGGGAAGPSAGQGTADAAGAGGVMSAYAAYQGYGGSMYDDAQPSRQQQQQQQQIQQHQQQQHQQQPYGYHYGSSTTGTESTVGMPWAGQYSDGMEQQAQRHQQQHQQQQQQPPNVFSGYTVYSDPSQQQHRPMGRQGNGGAELQDHY